MREADTLAAPALAALPALPTRDLEAIQSALTVLCALTCSAQAVVAVTAPGNALPPALQVLVTIGATPEQMQPLLTSSARAVLRDGVPAIDRGLQFTVPIWRGAVACGLLSVLRDAGADARDEHQLLGDLAASAAVIGRLLGASSDAPSPRAETDFIGGSLRMQRVRNQIRVSAASSGNVVIHGEPGTGKEAVARAIHDASARGQGPFVQVHCATLTSESFAARPGDDRPASALFAAAIGGSLLFDEIDQLAPELQPLLLHALQLWGHTRVGRAALEVPAIRMMFTTSRDLAPLAASGVFSRSLYYRIHVISIQLPPLRERRDDIAPLAREFVRRHNASTGRMLELEARAVTVLQRCGWPGNVRELENCIEHATSATTEGVIGAEVFPCRRCLARLTPQDTAVVPAEDGRRAEIIQALERCGWVQAKAARLLNMSPRQIGYAIKQLDIEMQHI